MPTGHKQKIAVIMGDGIGKEVVPEGMRVLDVAGERFGFKLDWTPFPWSCEYYSSTGEMMPKNGLDILKEFDAIFLGAVGYPGGPGPHIVMGAAHSHQKGFSAVCQLQTREKHEGHYKSPASCRSGTD